MIGRELEHDGEQLHVVRVAGLRELVVDGVCQQRPQIGRVLLQQLSGTDTKGSCTPGKHAASTLHSSPLRPKIKACLENGATEEKLQNT